MPTIAGMILGYITNVVTGDIWATIGIAVLTGAAAYIGQQIAKYGHGKLKKKKK